MRRLKNLTVGPWPKGLDMKVSDGALDSKALKEARNVLIDHEGIVAPANKLQLRQEGSFNTVFYSRATTLTLLGSNLGLFTDEGDQLSSVDMTRALFHDYGGGCYVHTARGMYQVAPNKAVHLMSRPQSMDPDIEIIAGLLPAGVYTVGIDHPVAPLSPLVAVTLQQQGGLRLKDMAAGERVFVSNGDGDELLYHGYATEDGDYDVTRPPDGPIFDQLSLTPLPKGQKLGFLGFRSLSAEGRTLWYSVPHRFGLTDRSKCFIYYDSPITLMHSQGAYVYVGTQEGLFQVTGLGEPEQKQVQIYEGPVLDVVPCRIDLSRSLPDASGEAFVFATQQGFCIVTRAGEVLVPQADRVELPLDTAGVLVYHQDRVTLIGATNV